ncbi:MAG: hypothetical protein LUC92_04625 [Clostridiales bacterium]|nr:hypothetical protein [Clostridiales bacterium]
MSKKRIALVSVLLVCLLGFMYYFIIKAYVKTRITNELTYQYEEGYKEYLEYIRHMYYADEFTHIEDVIPESCFENPDMYGQYDLLEDSLSDYREILISSKSYNLPLEDFYLDLTLDFQEISISPLGKVYVCVTYDEAIKYNDELVSYGLKADMVIEMKWKGLKLTPYYMCTENWQRTDVISNQYIDGKFTEVEKPDV